jgi:hypothetical protein
VTEYLKPSFSVAMPSNQSWRDNWDAIFQCKEELADYPEGGSTCCTLKRKHDGHHEAPYLDGVIRWPTPPEEAHTAHDTVQEDG